MSYTTKGYDRAKRDMLGKLNKAIRAADDVRKAATEAEDAAAAGRATSGDGPGGAGPGLEENAPDAGRAGQPSGPASDRVVP